jgi:lactoylglutathione lyase
MTYKPTFKILGVQQIAIAGTALKDLEILWINMLGLNKSYEKTIATENVRESILNFSQANQPEITLLEPIDPNQKPQVQNNPLNHIGLWVDDLKNAVNFLKTQGFRIPGEIRKGASGYDIAFIHPKDAQGVLIELVQAPANLIETSKN